MMNLRKYLVATLLVVAACGKDNNGDQECPEGYTCTKDDAGSADAGASDAAASDSGADTGSGFYTFPGEKVACQVNEKYLDEQAVLAGNKNNPTGRGEQAGVYDPCNERVIIFAGNDRQPAECDTFGPKNYLGDTWAYSLEYENWYKVPTSNPPPARGRHAVALDKSRKRMLIFGGRFRAPEAESTDPYTLYDDLWAYEFNTDEWSRIDYSTQGPSPRTNSAMVYDDINDRLILFGGNSSTNGLAFAPLGDTWVFDLQNETWTLVTSEESPSPRLFHTMVMDGAHNQVLLYSGGDENSFLGGFYNDVWALDLDSLQWSLLWQGLELGGGCVTDADCSGTRRGCDGGACVEKGTPPPRINATFVEDRERGRVLLFGGHEDTALGNDNDIWSFDPESTQWSLVQEGDVYTGEGCPAFCECADNFVQYDTEAPERRQYQTFAPVDQEGFAIMFGGTGDCGYLDDTWYLDLAEGEWTEIHAAEQGIACERTGRENCEELCF
jgi:N-acetylneuraminic acid mutarotase